MRWRRFVRHITYVWREWQIEQVVHHRVAECGILPLSLSLNLSEYGILSFKTKQVQHYHVHYMHATSTYLENGMHASYVYTHITHIILNMASICEQTYCVCVCVCVWCTRVLFDYHVFSAAATQARSVVAVEGDSTRDTFLVGTAAPRSGMRVWGCGCGCG